MDMRMLGPEDIEVLLRVEPGLFDHPVDPAQARAFLASPLNRIAVAMEAGAVVAFASGTVLLHPDKAPSLFINEVGTRESHRRRGFGAAVTQALIDRARVEGCEGVWLGTEPDNAPARGLYRRLGGQEMAFVGYGWDGAFDA